MDWDDLGKPLEIDQIDFRVQSINKGGYATILAYKDARVDMDRLDEVVGRGKWQRKHERIGDTLYCSVGLYNDEIKEWVWVQDVGVPSNAESTKGEASDAFKRACFNLGIGRELYEFPIISVPLMKDEWEMKKQGNYDKPTATWKLKIREWQWYMERNNRGVSYLAAKDQNNTLRFEAGTKGAGSPSQSTPAVETQPTATPEQEFAQKLVGELHGGDSASLYDVWHGVDNEMKEAAWRHISSSDRAAIKNQLAQEEQNR